MRHRYHRGSPVRRGTTLVEVAVSAVLVGLMLVATMNAVGAVFRTRLVARQRQQGETLARELMAEIFQASYEDPQGGTTFGLEPDESGSTRAKFDDVDDYHGYSESSLADKAGTALPDCTGWSRKVTISRVEPAQPMLGVTGETGVKLITVTATSPSGQQFTLQALRAKKGTLEYRPPLDRTYVTGVSGTVEIGAASVSTASRTTIVNHAE
jgi:Tfp pilus assembly protein PilV